MRIKSFLLYTQALNSSDCNSALNSPLPLHQKDSRNNSLTDYSLPTVYIASCGPLQLFSLQRKTSQLPYFIAMPVKPLLSHYIVEPPRANLATNWGHLHSATPNVSVIQSHVSTLTRVLPEPPEISTLAMPRIEPM